MSQLRIACTWSGTIYAGRVCKDNVTLRSGKTDVTSDVLNAVIELLKKKSNTMVVHVDGKPKFEITLKEYKTTKEKE